MRKSAKRFAGWLAILTMIISVIPQMPASAAPETEDTKVGNVIYDKTPNTLYEAGELKSASKFTGDVKENDNAPDSTSFGGSFKANDYFCITSVGFDQKAYNTFMMFANVPQESEGKQIEIHLDKQDGDLIGTVTLAATPDENVFKEVYADVTAQTGTHDVYLVFNDDTQLNVDYMTFSAYNGSETTEEKDARMAWWRDAKYGLFIHWGAYAYLGGEYNGRGSEYSEWLMFHAGIGKEEYKQAAAEPFNPTQFDAAGIVKNAKDAGQKYVVLTSRHHEGLSMYDTHVKEFEDYSLFSTSNYGNYQGTDPAAELAKECEKQGLEFGVYYTIMDWHDKSQSDLGGTMDMSQKEDFNARMKEQLRELVVDYGVKVLFFDGEWVDWWSKEDGQELYRYLRTLNPGLVINNRVGKRGVDDGDYGTPEQEIPATGLDYDWESCMTLNNSWGYHKTDNNWKDAKAVITNLVDCVSKGGNYLLNIGPDADGIVPEESNKILLEAGEWLATYGDSIYSTDHSCFTRLPGGVQATVKDGKIYLHISDLESNRTLMIPAIENKINSVKVMGTDEELHYDPAKDGIAIDLDQVVQDPYDTIVVMDVEGYPKEVEKERINYAQIADKVEAEDNNYYFGMEDYAPSKAVDGNGNTRWATNDNTTSAKLILTYDEPITVNHAYIHRFENNAINKYIIEYLDGDEWKAAYAADSFSDVKADMFFDPVTTTAIRLNILEANNPSIYEFQLYNDERIEVNITDPQIEAATVLEGAPYTISGTAIGGDSVDVTISGVNFQAVKQNAVVNEDGTWMAVFEDKLAPGNVNIKAALKDGNSIVKVTTISVPLRGYKNLAKGKPVTASTEYTLIPGYAGSAAVDGSFNTRWSPDDNDPTPNLTVDLGEPTSFDRIIISEQEDIWNQPYDYRCRQFKIECLDGDEWVTVHEGTTIGKELLIDLPQPVRGSEVRLSILDSRTLNDGKKYPANIIEFELYCTKDDADELDVSALLNKIAEAKDIQKENYGETSWNALQNAIAAAEEKLDTVTTEDEVDAAVAELQQAIDGLKQAASITLGNLNQIEGNVTEVEVFTEPEGLAVQVLYNGEETLPGTAGEYTVEVTIVDDSYEGSANAILTIREMVDKTDLDEAIESANKIELSDYVTAGKDAFITALENATVVSGNEDASKEDVENAYNALADAIENLKLKANKAALSELINEYASVDLDKFTDTSVADYERVLAEANAVMADEELSEDDQIVVDNVIARLQSAYEALQIKTEGGEGGNTGGEGGNTGGEGGNTGGEGGNTGDNSGNTGGNSGNSGNNNAGKDNNSGNSTGSAVKTGDTANIFFPIIGIVAAIAAMGGCIVLNVRKRRR